MNKIRFFKVAILTGSIIFLNRFTLASENISGEPLPSFAKPCVAMIGEKPTLEKALKGMENDFSPIQMAKGFAGSFSLAKDGSSCIILYGSGWAIEYRGYVSPEADSESDQGMKRVEEKAITRPNRFIKNITGVNKDIGGLIMNDQEFWPNDSIIIGSNHGTFKTNIFRKEIELAESGLGKTITNQIIFYPSKKHGIKPIKTKLRLNPKADWSFLNK